MEAATDADLDRVYSVNVKGVFHCLQEACKAMTSNGVGGSIVNLASVASLVGLKDRFAYGMTKGAVLTMTYSIATDYMHKGIRCNAVAPTRVHTPFVVSARIPYTFPLRVDTDLLVRLCGVDDQPTAGRLY